ncbi:uncharacterized protein LOC114302797 [Camellia sinensis]|uniref:uncharacterized protein LOC114302797 n=1 Tax=Camellia sinensis TaxID=4442 RepID=UPI001036A4EB|nr:uncharacterized protein LOC114302797 [Camellia sinensis]
MDIKEEELLGKALADLLASSTAEAESINLGDSFTISMIGDNPTVDFSNLIVDASEAPRLLKMTNFNPLSKILDDNRLTGSNYVDWKRSLTIVLTTEKLNHVQTTDPPVLPEANATDEQREAARKWHEADDVAKCYILASVTNVLQKQHEGVPTAKDMMVNLKEMFGEQSKNIDGETKIDSILLSLPNSYNQFILNYNMNKMIVAPSKMLNKLQAAEDLIKKSQPTMMMSEKEVLEN